MVNLRIFMDTMGLTFYTGLGNQKLEFGKNIITTLLGIRNYPYVQIFRLLGVGVGEIFERKIWKFENHVTDGAQNF